MILNQRLKKFKEHQSITDKKLLNLGIQVSQLLKDKNKILDKDSSDSIDKEE